MASPSEGFSLALAEAWYCGVPVAATRVGAIPELERCHGPLVAPLDIAPSPEALADAVDRSLTPAFGAEVIPRARRIVAQYYTSGTMAQRWTDYLSAIHIENTYDKHFARYQLSDGFQLPK